MATAPTTALMSIVRAEVKPAGFRQIACYDFTKADHGLLPDLRNAIDQSNRVAMGGSSGIGKETAKRWVAEGASVVLGGEDEAKLLCGCRRSWRGTGRVRVLAGDIGKRRFVPSGGVRFQPSIHQGKFRDKSCLAVTFHDPKAFRINVTGRDLTFRVGDLEDSSLVAHRILKHRHQLPPF